MPRPLLLVLLLLTWPLLAFDRSLFFRNIENHFMETLPSGTVDWTGGYLFSRSEVRLERIEPNQTDKVGSITQARIQAREKARHEASLKLMQSLGQLRLDSRGTLEERMRQEKSLATSLATVKDSFLIKSSRTGEGFVSIELALPFTGPQGLLRRLRPSTRSHLPVTAEGPLTEEITGIIVDTTFLPDFKPALHPSLYNEVGLKIYSEEIAGNCVIRRGAVGYYGSLELARRDLRAGRKPYILYATGTNGPSGAVLSAADTEVLLQSPGGRRSLRSCRVLLVVKGR